MVGGCVGALRACGAASFFCVVGCKVNKKLKRRVVAVTGVIVIVLIVILAVVGSGSSAKTLSLAEAIEGDWTGVKIQVSGNVVANSYETDDEGTLTFTIYDPDGDMTQQLDVRFEGGVSATFGNEVTAICTGRIGEDGVLECSSLVTKCPSKYENASDALSVAQMLDYGDSIVDTVVKVAGTIEAGTLVAAGNGDRFLLVDASDASVTVAVLFDDALGDEIGEGSAVVLTGAMTEDGKFAATEVALEG